MSDLPKVEKPIEITNSTAAPTAEAAFRYAVSLGLAVAVSRGWIEADSVPGYAAMLTSLVMVIWGLWKTRNKQAQLIVAGKAAPNSVAMLKGE